MNFRSALLFMLCLGLLFSSRLVLAADASIKNIVISNSYTHLNIQFKLAKAFDPKMEEAIATGIATTFRFYINLYQHRSMWNDRLLKSVTLERTLKYDTLKKEYLVTSRAGGDNGIATEVFTTLQEAKKCMSSVEILSFYPIWKLERNSTYAFTIKAESKGVEPPAYLHYLLFFLKSMNFETPLVEEKFNY